MNVNLKTVLSPLIDDQQLAAFAALECCADSWAVELGMYNAYYKYWASDPRKLVKFFGDLGIRVVVVMGRDGSSVHLDYPNGYSISVRFEHEPRLFLARHMGRAQFALDEDKFQDEFQDEVQEQFQGFALDQVF